MPSSNGKIVPVVLAGGAGARLWPLSRTAYPKQLIALTGANSMLQETLDRVADQVHFAAPSVICNEDYRFLVAELLRQTGRDFQRIVLEPLGRNTAPAICAAALLAAEEDPEAVVLTLPSDHHLPETDAFVECLRAGAAAARGGWLVTFGIAPRGPETGYGYIKQGALLDGIAGCHRVDRFEEKPTLAVAEDYLAAGNYLWNSGMFMFRPADLLAEFERLAPQLLTDCRQAVRQASSELDFLRLDKAAFSACEAISFDHAIMEKTERAAVVPSGFAWSDAGSWDSLWQIAERDADGNALRGDVIAIDSQDSYLRSEDRLLAALGVRDLTIVASRDAVLVCPRDRTQDVRAVVEALEAAERSEQAQHPQVFRPWGSYQGIDQGPAFQVKRLIVNPGASISLQRHRKRAEHWVVVQGEAEVTRDGEVFALCENESTYIPIGTIHRLRNPGEEPLHIIEVQTGGYLGEDDIERFEDIYGRKTED